MTKRQKLEHYKNRRNEYIPNDLTKFKALVLALTAEESKKRHHNANYRAYALNGIDTLAKPEPFLDSELDRFKKLNKNEKSLPLFDKTLRKKLNFVYATTTELENFDTSIYRYLLDVEITSTKATPETIGFVVSYNYFFVDRLTGKKYKPIYDHDISLGDLID